MAFNYQSSKCLLDEMELMSPGTVYMPLGLMLFLLMYSVSMDTRGSWSHLLSGRVSWVTSKTSQPLPPLQFIV